MNNNYKILSEEKSSKSSFELQNNQQSKSSEQLEKLQITIGDLTLENNKLKQTIDQYQELLDNMQNTSNQISLSYDQTLTQTRNKYDEEIRRLLQKNNQLEGKLNSLSKKGKELNSNASLNDLKNFEEDIQRLERIRKEHKQHKPDASLSVEEIQEEKIHQLLEEISCMEDLVNKVGVVDKIQELNTSKKETEELENKLIECKSELEFTVREKQTLLNAIETGDLNPYLELQKEAEQRELTKKEIEELTKQIAELEQAQNEVIEKKEEIPSNNNDEKKEKPKKRGWFW